MKAHLDFSGCEGHVLTPRKEPMYFMILWRKSAMNKWLWINRNRQT